MAGHSVTFAVLFGVLLLGVSLTQTLRQWLGEIAAPWYMLWIIPAVMVGVLAKLERLWQPDPRRRRWCARLILIASFVTALGLWWIKPKPQEETEPDAANIHQDEGRPSPKPTARPGSPSRR